MKPATGVRSTAREVKPLNDPGRGASKQDKEVPDGPPDSELVRRAQAGDRAAFRALFDRYHRRAFAVAMGVVRTPDDATDIVQDAFVKVHRHLAKFQGSSSFYTWLYRIVMNLAIDHIRKGKRTHVDFDERFGGTEEDAAGDGALVPSIMDANPGKAISRRELSAQLQQALAGLPEYHRAVILLREVEGLSYEEIAETLQVPKGTVMSRLFHARKKMQQALRPYIEGEQEIED